MGIDWEIDEVQAQIDEDNYYLSELLSIKDEAIHAAYQQYEEFSRQFDDTVK